MKCQQHGAGLVILKQLQMFYVVFCYGYLNRLSDEQKKQKQMSQQFMLIKNIDVADK